LRLTKKELELMLEKVPERVGKLGWRYEQYPTPSHIAADVLWRAYINGDVEDKLVADLGCGTGRFAYGAELLGGRGICVELDGSLLKISPCLERVQAFVPLVPLRNVNTVISNPPFGTKRRKSDRVFLEASFSLARSIYLLHHRGAVNFIRALGNEFGFLCTVLSHYNFPLRQLYKFHKSRRKSTEVVLVFCTRM